MAKTKLVKEKFLALVEENKGIVFKVCNMYCNHPEDREDLFQDIILQLWRAYPSFKGDSKVSTWIYRIALNVSITRLRKEKKHRSHQELNEEALSLPTITSTNVEDTRMMYQAIQLLSDIEKAIITLYMDDYSYKEIAEVIGITESNVGFKLNKIKAKLKNMINKF